MNKQIPSYLRLVTDTNNQTAVATAEDLASIVAVCRAFEQATRWKLQYADASAECDTPNLMWSAPVDPGVGTSPGHIRLFYSEQPAADEEPLPLARVIPLAAALARQWAELFGARGTVAEREAELAAGIPVVRPDDAMPLGPQLEAVLRGGAEAIGCQAAGLYLLDPATTELKLRAGWGLPRKRLAEPARPLRGAVADLEALLGHAVVMSDRTLFEYWKVPEQGFGSCVCVPISNAAMPLGTLWAFCREPREFSDVQTNILEVVAGRLAADLERQVLVGEALAAREEVQQLNLVEETQQEHLPPTGPLIDGWDVAATVHHAGRLGSAFYDWFSLDDDSVAVVAGAAQQSGVGGAMTGGSLRTAARALAPQRALADGLLDRVNSVLWTTSSGEQSAALFQAILDPRGRHSTLSAAGPVRAIVLSGDSHRRIAVGSEPLGLQESIHIDPIPLDLEHGDLLVIFGASWLNDADDAVLADVDESLATALLPRRDQRAAKLLESADAILSETTCLLAPATDRLLVVIKRR